ncbi:MAG: metal-dependent hydrolase [Candidatus Cloacimonadota bacterium]|nr:MAG: metal-dependent hydrolase [Candidatus Cloacimonadota bacterium]PIE80637.1 MAG: metal-dependent hydrolase [Candidatus Delongbacteria bacterium]
MIKYIEHYPEEVKNKVKLMIEKNSLKNYLLINYSEPHNFTNNKLLYKYVINLKNRYMKRSIPLSSVSYDDKIETAYQALGVNIFHSKVHGKKLKSKNSIKISTFFKHVPESFLQMIAVHELAHFKEKDHNKQFYNLCKYMKDDYFQVEFDTRLYMIYLDMGGKEIWV